MAKLITDVAVIGGGLSGLTVALSLHKYGIKSTVYESRPRSYEAGGYIALGPSAARVLSHLGLWDTIVADGYAYERMEVLNTRGSVVGTFFSGSRRLQGFPSMRTRRTKLREVLLSEMNKRGIEIVYEKSLHGLTEAGEVVELSFGDGTVVTSGMVIGADGLRSVVRKVVAPDAQPYYNGLTVMYGLAEKEQLDQETLNFPVPSMTLGPTGSFAIIPVDPAGDRLGFVIGIQLPDRSKEEWQAFQKDKDGLRAVLAGYFGKESWPTTVRTLCRETVDDEILSWPVFVLPELTKWTSASGRVVLIGDAAHGMSPASAQGGAMAFEDAETLAYALTRDGVVSTRLVPVWEKHRQQRVRKVVAYTTDIERRRRPSPNAVLQTIKEWILWVLFWYYGEAGISPWLSNYDGREQMAALCDG